MKRRFFSVILTLILLIGMLPANALPVYADTTNHELALEDVANLEYISDTDAIWGYRDYFKADSTEYAGAVWTDKSVFTKRDNLASHFAITKDSTDRTADITVEQDNFLISLSALAATKEVLGYSNLPSDTVLILDVSNSMDSSELTSMVEAANKAIEELLNLNLHNRVGVVVYGSDASILLPIGRYETTRTTGYGANAYNVYLEHVNGQIRTPRTTTQSGGWFGNSTTTYHVTDADSNPVNRYINTGGATYIQGGMYQALALFDDIQDTAIDTGLIQGGTKRIPIVVLMSDGAPTIGSTNYTTATNANSNLGTGYASSISDNLVFPAQLTAAYLRSFIEEHYGRESLFYTLGYDVEHAEARRVLDPANNTSNTVNNWWNNYENTEVDRQVSGYESNNNRITRKEAANESLYAYRYYTDQYFPATNTNGLIDAFDRIVSQIVIQSKYYPTLVEGGDYSLDGYVTFEDELGRYMEVKSIKGLVLENTIFTGAAFTAALNEPGKFGNASTWTEYGEEFLVSVQERLNIRNDQARTLLSAAWRSTDNQLTEDHFVGWYADAAGNYLGHWDTQAHTAVNYPKDTKYLNKCYFFYGELNEDFGHVDGGDMMYIIVQVHKDITTGEECVIYKIPASLVPMTKYTVEVNSNSYDTATEVKLNMAEESPIRLLFEVGMIDEINQINLLEYMNNEEHVHPVKDASGNIIGYAFYSNRWGIGHILDGSGVTDKLDPNNHLAVVTHFHPSMENERYYYTENSYIYSDENGTLYTGSKPSGDGYYHRYRMIQRINANSEEASIIYKYVPIASEVLSATGELAIKQDNNGSWYIPAGQIYQQIARHRVEKKDIAANNDNITGTLTYYDYPVLIHPTSESEDYHIYDFLGNNGRLIMYSAQGIKLSKTIDDATIAAGTKEFDFDVALTNKNNVPNDLKILDENGAELTGRHTVNGNTITVTVKNDETVYITGLETGTTYEVTEKYHDEYRVKHVTAEAVNGEKATGTVEQYVLDDVAFVNTASSHKGDLIITKEVTHNYGDEYEIPGKEFTVIVSLGSSNAGGEFEVTGTVQNGIDIKDPNLGITNTEGKLTADGNGDITLYLAHEDSVTIKGIPENTVYSVEEPASLIPTGFDQKTPDENLTGTIITDQTLRADLVNEYSVSTNNSTTITIDGTKNIDGRAWLDSDTFQFQLQEYLNGWTDVEGAVGTATKANHEFEIAKAINYTVPGTHYYRVVEVEPDTNEIVGIAYDKTVYAFAVHVTDIDMDGYLEVTTSGNATVNGSGDIYAITLQGTDFTNRFHQAVATINLYKELTNETGREIHKTDFVFGLYDENNNQITTVSPGIGGNAVINMTYAGEPATHTYYLKEIAGNVIGMTYDPTEYQVLVNVDGNDTDGYTATTVINEMVGGTWKPVSDNVALFDNTYELESVAAPLITGTKNFTGPAAVNNFEFAIYNTNSNFAVAEGTQPLDTAVNGADGTFTFEHLGTYTKVGHYYYVVKEIAGTNPAVTYDDAEYHVTVHVAPHATEAKLEVASVTINEIGGSGSEIIFENTYTILEKAKITVNGDKDVTNKNILPNEFTFGLYSDSACTTSIADATEKTEAAAAAISGAFAFDFEYEAAGTHTYYIKEIPNSTNYAGVMTYDETVYQVVIVVTDNGQGVLTAANPIITKVNDTAETALKFVNKYEPTSVTGLNFSFTKSFVENATNAAISTWPNNGFHFALYSADDKYNITDSNPVHTVVATNANAAVTVTLPEYDKAGTFYYVFKEIAGEDHTISYDSAEHHIMVVITDYDGELKGSIYVDGDIANNSNAPHISFRNIHTTVYADDIVRIKKNLTNNSDVEIGLDIFRFGFYTDESCETLATLDGTEITTAADMNGDASMYYQYNDSYIGESITSKTDTYYVKEIIPTDAIEGMTYDKSVYKVAVNINYNKNDPQNPILTATQNITKIVGADGVKLDAEEAVESIVFENSYEPPFVPDDDDDDDKTYKSFLFTKVWDDNNDMLGKRPESVVVELYQDGVYVMDLTLSEENSWVNTAVLLYSKDGHVYEWTIKEKNIPSGYVATYKQSEHTVINTLKELYTPTGGTSTGDNSPIGLFLGISAVCLIAIIALVVFMKFRKKDKE